MARRGMARQGWRDNPLRFFTLVGYPVSGFVINTYLSSLKKRLLVFLVITFVTLVCTFSPLYVCENFY